MRTGIVNVERVATQKGLGTDGAGVGEKAGEMDGLHMVAGESPPGSREVVAELAIERFARVLGIRTLAHVLPQVHIGRGS